MQQSPTSEAIADWKLEYGSVYSVTLPKGIECFFRALTVGELQKLTISHMTSVEVEEMAVKYAVLYPEINFEDLPAGIISGLSEEIFEHSGLISADEARKALEEGRIKCRELIIQMKAFIIAAMPNYTLEQLDTLTYSELTFRVAMAEEIIKVQQSIFGIDGDLTFNIVDLEEEARKAEEEEKKKRERQKAAYETLVARGGMQFMNEDSAPIIQPKIDPRDPIAAQLWNS